MKVTVALVIGLFVMASGCAWGAVSKCVLDIFYNTTADTAKTECESYGPDGGAALDWAVRCRPADVTITSVDVLGLGVCAGSPENGGGPQSYISPSTDVTSNTVCYCKIISPVESLWMQTQKFQGENAADACAEGCAVLCKNLMLVVGYSAPARIYRALLFGSVH